VGFGVILAVEAETGLSGRRIGAMAGEAGVGKNREDVTIEGHLGRPDRGDEEDGKNNKNETEHGARTFYGARGWIFSGWRKMLI
jgi:hypothetical protein